MPNDNKNPLAELIHSLPKDVKNIAFGDSDHASPEIREALAAPEVIAALKDRGIGVFIPEGPESLNQAIEDHKSGKKLIQDVQFDTPYHMDNPTLQQQYTQSTKAYLTATADNFAVKYIDEGYASIPEKAEKQLSDIARFASDHDCKTPKLTAYTATLTEQDITSLTNIAKARTSTDLNNSIADKAATLAHQQPSNAQGIATLYGLGHLTNAQDLDEGLSKHGKTVTIALFPTKDIPSTLPLNLVKTDIPDFSYFIKEKMPVDNSTRAGEELYYQHFANSPTLKQPQAIDIFKHLAKKIFSDPSEHTKPRKTDLECFNELPENIRNHPNVMAIKANILGVTNSHEPAEVTLPPASVKLTSPSSPENHIISR